MTGRLHWIGYWKALSGLVIVALGAASLMMATGTGIRALIEILMIIVAGLSLFSALQVALHRLGTEIAVTDRRVIVKRGIISRWTQEMNVDKIETVMVEQSLVGRFLDFGKVTIKGSGASIEPLPQVAGPIALRSAITAR